MERGGPVPRPVLRPSPPRLQAASRIPTSPDLQVLKQFAEPLVVERLQMHLVEGVRRRTALRRRIVDRPHERAGKVEHFGIKMCELSIPALKSCFQKSRPGREQFALGGEVREYRFDLAVVEFTAQTVVRRSVLAQQV